MSFAAPRRGTSRDTSAQMSTRRRPGSQPPPRGSARRGPAAPSPGAHDERRQSGGGVRVGAFRAPAFDAAEAEETRNALRLLGGAVRQRPAPPSPEPAGYSGFRGAFEGDAVSPRQVRLEPEANPPVAAADNFQLSARSEPSVRFELPLERPTDEEAPRGRGAVAKSYAFAAAGLQGAQQQQQGSAEARALAALGAPPPGQTSKGPVSPATVATGSRRRPPSAPARGPQQAQQAQEVPRSALWARGAELTPAAAQCRRLAQRGRR